MPRTNAYGRWDTSNARKAERLAQKEQEPLDGIFWFKTDQRGFFRQANQTARVRTEAQIDTKEIGPNTTLQLLGNAVSSASQRRHPPDGEIMTANADPTGGSWKLPSTKPCQMKILMEGSGKYPFTPPEITPAIDYSVTWTFKVIKKSFIEVTVEGTHDGFPNYEAVINYAISVYQFDTPDSGPDPINLNTPHQFKSTITILAETATCDDPIIIPFGGH